MKRGFWLLGSLLLPCALAGGREPAPPVFPSADSELGRKGHAFDRAYAGRMQMEGQALLEMCNTTIATTKNPQILQAAQQTKAAYLLDRAQLQRWQKAWGEGVGAYGIVDIIGPGNNVDHWFLLSSISLQKQMMNYSRYALNNSRRPEVKQFARNFIASRTAQNETYTRMLRSMAVLIQPAPLANLQGEAFDVQWVGEMLALQRLSVALAQHELKAGTNRKVQRRGQVVLQQAGEQVTRLTDWELRWNVNLSLFGPVDIEMPMPDQVDRWFLEQVILYQAKAFALAELAKGRTQNVIILKWADRFIQDHATQMKINRALLQELP